MKKKIKVIMSTITPNMTTRLMYMMNFHKMLRLNNPQGINEKLQYLKLKTYYNNPVVTRCVDKYLVRGYIKEKGYAKLLPDLVSGGGQRLNYYASNGKIIPKVLW